MQQQEEEEVEKEKKMETMVAQMVVSVDLKRRLRVTTNPLP